MVTEMDHLAMGLARAATEDSKCEGRIVGCVLLGKHGEILASGTNTLPTGCDHREDHIMSPGKYQWVEHAERSAIYGAARNGTPLGGSTAYTTLFPCCDCARGLIESGVSRVVSYTPDLNDPRWGENFKVSLRMFSESGVDVAFLDGDA